MTATKGMQVDPTDDPDVSSPGESCGEVCVPPVRGAVSCQSSASTTDGPDSAIPQRAAMLLVREPRPTRVPPPA